METEYDIFEILLNRSVKWHLCAQGRKGALYMLKLVGDRTLNECFAIDLGTRATIARVNCGNAAAPSIIDNCAATAGNSAIA